MSNVLKEKSFAFAVRIVKLYNYLCNEKCEYVMSKQLLRSGTAIGALYREAESAESKPDFIHKLGIAKKETNETLYWLELLSETGYIDEKQFASIYPEAEELIKLLTSIIKASRINN
ncbi:four helix bundle protein [Methylomonas rosea]|uniref:Four helix bundle protein n=1 Tax=Methylomonas rosea TaxID=2952227 RepID=A0ABT1TWL9_9GAMM|nr:four helix bundle protein [Methylomonas sp. WSC-7]MCQ8118832.1 four helix bundle protein [Methylomonas sp. WSC-7]